MHICCIIVSIEITPPLFIFLVKYILTQEVVISIFYFKNSILILHYLALSVAIDLPIFIIPQITTKNKFLVVIYILFFYIISINKLFNGLVALYHICVS